MAETCLVLPAGGTSSRMRLPYPKELLAVDENTLLIDYSLMAAAKAGIDTAYIGLTYDKLRLVSGILGPNRQGVSLQYVLLEHGDGASDASSALRCCRRAMLADKFRQFLIAAPDFIVPRLDMQMMLNMKCPSAMRSNQDGAVLLSLIDIQTLTKLRRRLASVDEDLPGIKKQGLLSKLVHDEIASTRLVWETTSSDSGFHDVNTWADLKGVRVL